MQLGFSNNVLLKHQTQNIRLEPIDVPSKSDTFILCIKDHAHEQKKEVS